MWNGQTVSVVFPAYNEEENIAKAVEDFLATGLVDEVVVVDNNSTDRTREQADQTPARVVTETNQGYGWACRRALASATSDLVVIAEPDGTFAADDIRKLLVYADSFPVVFGTRTSKACIWSGANMGWMLRMGNVVVAKLLEYLHNGPCLTDVGCTMKLVRHEAYQQVAPHLRVGGSHFNPEFMIQVIRNKIACVEVPLNYRGRIGMSKITGKLPKAMKLGMIMVGMIIKYRLALPRGKPSAEGTGDA